MLPMARTIKMLERLADNLADGGFAQNAAPGAFIEPHLDACSKTPMIPGFLPGRRRRRIPFQPRGTFRGPLIETLLRNGVGEPNGDEISCAVLLPMRQTILVSPYRFVLVEETQVSKGSGP